MPTSHITIRGARLHNLKNISITIPKDQLVVLTGVSGSGKSTLGFDILNKEGQRQYLESLGFVTFGLSQPPVDSISGLSPTISLDQRLTNTSPRSTVGTASEVYTYLRVLYARLAHRPCPACSRDLPPPFDPAIQSWDPETGEGDGIAPPESTFPCPHCGSPVPEVNMAHFSFNKPEGACPTCTGLGYIQAADLKQLVDETKSIPQGAILAWNPVQVRYHGPNLQAAAAHYGFDLDLDLPIRDYTQVQRDLLFYGVGHPRFERHFPDVEPPRLVRQGRFEGIAANLLRRYAERVQEPAYREKMRPYLVTETCPDCGGNRLRPESRLFTLRGRTIIDLARLPLTDLGAWLAALTGSLNPDEGKVAAPILADLGAHIQRLAQVGAGYLSLERGAPSLSAGEAQRLRLASLLGSSLSGLLYIFDEPTIGLHPRDTRRLVEVLRRLRDLGNTILVIEHDLEMIRSADHILDFGPGAGVHGGRVVAAGTPVQVAANLVSLTGDYLAGRRTIPLPAQCRTPGTQAVTLRGARHHNLRDLNVTIPLGLFVAVSGVSGAGKSSLVFDTLAPALRQRLHGSNETPGKYHALDGWQALQRVITIDQAHLGRLPRSNAATYTDTFTPIRQAFAATPEARALGLTPRHFSFNRPGGRCERCQGTGTLSVQMHFLPDVEVTCPTCRGRRFTPQVLDVRYRGHNIAQVLDLTVEEALALFDEVPTARSRLQVLTDIGLGYLQLGQPATTLSGGEAQRVKLAKELGRRAGDHTLYLLDEPTTGLHLADTARLLAVLQRLVSTGHSLIVVEHNLEVLKCADWIIDLGPEGGAAGGRLVAAGTPEQVARTPTSHTGRFLKEMLDLPEH